MRAIIPAILMGVFLGWILYRSVIKHDLKEKKNLDLLKFGMFFFGVWALIYVVVIYML